jgi:transcriptional regulator GlxA family with amidase domain
MVITDGPFTTAGAALAQIDLMLALVARHAGAEVADMCSRYMLLDARQSQASYVSLEFVTAGDARLRRARDWVRARMAEDFTIPALASAAGMSPRTFARRLAENTGLSPVRFVQRLRAERAAELLETTRLPVDEVAHQVGYADASTLRRVLRRHLGGRPHALRMAAREARSIQL